ncbi:hypothetical protein TSAR_002083 [Trichomalopsis sarcophagae]|uniref:Uncharacterized protein n=1 Tax=Trichomalopsis sarcophagae TaxID=543379 RepID=A0A232FES0_9HYME|nr:hypothetical protein TSAR_002083 [Trichomalopsis sarcophagae]
MPAYLLVTLLPLSGFLRAPPIAAFTSSSDASESMSLISRVAFRSSFLICLRPHTAFSTFAVNAILSDPLPSLRRMSPLLVCLTLSTFVEWCPEFNENYLPSNSNDLRRLLFKTQIDKSKLVDALKVVIKEIKKPWNY